MRIAIWAAASLFLCLAAAQPADAGCTSGQIKALLDSGAHEQVIQFCAVQGAGPEDPSPQQQGASDQGASTFSLGVVAPELGNDGIWNKYVRGGAYVVQNKFDPDGYFLLLSKNPVARGWRSLSIDARFHHDKNEGGIVGPARSFRIIFSARAALSSAWPTSNASREKPAVMAWSLWHMTQ